jgi:amino acid adenylation domain-containing protein
MDAGPSSLSRERELSLLRHWTRTLAGAPTVLVLPLDSPRPPGGGARGAAIHTDLDAITSEHLQQLAATEGCQLETVLLAAWLCLLSRWSGQNDLVVGWASDAASDEPIGAPANTLPVRGVFPDGIRFRAALRNVEDSVLDARAHQELPFEQLAAELDPASGPGRAPLCQVLFVTRDAPEAALRIDGIRVTPVETLQFAPRFDLALVVTGGRAARSFRFEYSCDLFERATIEAVAEQLAALLRGIVEDPDALVCCLPLVSPRDREAPGALSREVAPAPPPRQCLHELVAERAAISPDAIAVVCGDRRLTYRELDVRAERLARHLAALGAGPNVLVGVCVERSLDLCVAILAVLKAGSAYLPLDPASPPDRLAFMLRDAAAPIVLTQRSLAGRLPATAARTVCLDGLAGDLPSAPPRRATPASLAYCIYTSGSTGRPKGVLVSHANVTRLLTTTRAHVSFGEGDVWTLFHSFAFDFSVWELFGCLVHGGRLVIVPTVVAQSPDVFFDLLEREAVTVLNMTPSAFRQFMTVAAERPRLESLKVVIFGGEALHPAALASWTTRYGWDRPSLVNMYGITETTVHVSFRRLVPADARFPSRSPIGKPLGDIGIVLLDPALNPVPRGIPGEMYVRGPGLAYGYLNMPALTAERFVPDVHDGAAGGRAYRTGDLARLTHGGELEYLGRSDQQVKLRGYRIELGEIESCLASIHPVAEAAAALVGDAPEEPKIVAWITAKPGHRIDGARIREQASKVLPRYMMPARLIAVPSLPLNGNGKIDLRRLRELVDDTRPDEARFVPPTGDVQLELAAIWERVLGVRPVGASDNFFAIGGDSVTALQVVRAAQQRGIALTIIDLVASESLAALASAARLDRPQSVQAGGPDESLT